MGDSKTSDDWGSNIHISKHPVLYHKISILRSATTTSGQFRSVMRELTYHLGYEATADLKTREIPVSISVGKEAEEEHVDCTGHKIAENIALIPILRSGLGMSDGMLELLPKAAVHHIGMYHIPGAVPVQYYNRLPRTCRADIAFIVDPVIASAETVMAVIAMLKKWGVPKIHIVSVLASKEGLTKIKSTHPDVSVTVGMVDEALTKKGLILPGLGDCGDRLFHTHTLSLHDDDDEALTVPPSKRKRSADFGAGDS